MSLDALLYRKKVVANLLSMSVSKLETLVSTDASFPRPIKVGTNRQSSVFFNAAQVQAWVDRLDTQQEGM